MKKIQKIIIFIFAAVLLFSSCVPEEIPEQQIEPEVLEQKAEEGKAKPEKLFDPETEELFEILWVSEKPSEETAKKGYAFYGAEKCYGYENLLSFVKKYPENKEEHFYIVSYGTTWRAGKISYSETEESWIFTEYWIDTFRENERHEKDFDISEIIIYENRVSVYLENGNKKVFYEKGSELGLPINNCSHPLQAHYIEIEIIKYINSEEFKTKYEETHSEPYLDFDEFTKTLYGEEEKCLINIYHYIEYYGLTYDDFTAAYGSEENIAEIWAEADIKGYFGK